MKSQIEVLRAERFMLWATFVCVCVSVCVTDTPTYIHAHTKDKIHLLSYQTVVFKVICPSARRHALVSESSSRTLQRGLKLLVYEALSRGLKLLVYEALS